jgi:hypothetical protein
MRCRDLLKQKRYGEFLKWDNFKTLDVAELVAAREISERLLLQEEAVTGDFDKDMFYLRDTIEVFLRQLKMHRLNLPQFQKAFSREKMAVLTEIFAVGREEAYRKLADSGEDEALEEARQLVKEIGLHLNSAEIISQLINK